MAIDARIALGVQAPQFENPLTQLAQMEQLKGARQQNKLAEFSMNERQRASDFEGKRRNALSAALNPETGEIDAAAYQKGLVGIGDFDGLQTFKKGQAEQSKAAREAEKADLEKKLKVFETSAQIMGPVKDQASYDAARQQVAQMFGPQAAQQMPSQYDPQLIQQRTQQALSSKDQIEQQWKARGYDLDVAKFGETVRNNKTQNAISQGNLSVAQANLGLSRQRLAQEGAAGKGQYDAERGVLVDTRTGMSRPVMGPDGQPLAAKTKPLTESQGKAAGFGGRAQIADEIITGLQGKYSPSAINAKTSMEETPMIGGVMGALANSVLPANAQKAEQAQRDFINAVLRQESGAAIAESEFNNAKKQYFPQPGDSKAVIAQKAQNRKTAIQGFMTSAGPAGQTQTTPSAIPTGWSVQEN